MPKYNKKINDTNIRIGEVRFSYANVFAPKANKPGDKEKFSCCIIIPKENKEAIKLINEAVEAAKLAGKSSKWGGRIPANCKSPLRDGDEERFDDPAFTDCYFLNASTTLKPGVRVLENGVQSEAMDSEDFYSGCYGAVTLNFFPYENSGNKGVGAGLGNVIKIRDGKRMAGGRSADEDFGDLSADDELA